MVILVRTFFPLTIGPLLHPHHLCVGIDGESIVASYLRTLRYRVFAANVSLGKDEIDIVAFDPNDRVLVFVEVKTRFHFCETFPPHMNIHYKKRCRLRRSARAWVHRHGYHGGYRIDLVCVADGRVVDHIRELAWE